MTIEEKTNQIIAKRKSRLPRYNALKQRLEDTLKAIKCFEEVKRQFFTPTGEPDRNGHFGALLEQNPGLGDLLREVNSASSVTAIGAAQRLLDDCIQRNNRDTVQISVVGRARIGKSLLLQTLSGLSNCVIPSFDSTDCTGATSIIHNKQGATLQATLSFKTPEMMRELAQSTIDKIFPEKPEDLRLLSMADIERIDLDAIRNKIIKSNAPVNGIYLKSLENIVEHYQEWASLTIKREPITLTNEQEIMTYVAQNNGKKLGESSRKEYYRYLAVSVCDIVCAYPAKGLGKITLIDSIGLGDLAVGIEDSMLKTVKEESDAVIHFICPQNLCGGGIPSEISDIYTAIDKACADRVLNKWLFHLINEVAQENPALRVNTDICMEARKRIINSYWKGAEPQIINCKKDPGKVQEFFLYVLSSITDSLDEIDQLFDDRAAVALNEAQKAYHAFSSGIAQVLQSCTINNVTIAQAALLLTDETFAELRRQLMTLNEKWRTDRNQPNTAIYRNSITILRDLKQGNYVPQPEQIKEMIQGTQYVTIMMQLMNKIRNAVASDFEGLDQELRIDVNAMKNSVVDVLCTNIGLSRLCDSDEHQPKYEWLHTFAEMYLSDGLQYAELKDAFLQLYAYEFSMTGFMTYEIRNALSALDPNMAVIPPIRAADNAGIAMRIYASLNSMCVTAANTINASVKELCVKPSLAIWAALDSFVDRIAYTDQSERTWRQFFIGNSVQMWSGELLRQQQASAIENEWNIAVKTIHCFDSVGNFSIER